MHSPIVGLQAPDFTLPDANGRDVTLSQLRGQWVVLYFYPKDDTPGCTCEATEFTTLGTGFTDRNAKVLGISDDRAEIHRIFIQKFKLSVDLLSDPNHVVMRRYGAWVDARLGDTKYERIIRSTVLVDPAGVVRYHWPEVIPRGHAERVKEKLALLEAGAATSQPSR
jgi:peroxiredoxin Q/BCP